MKTNSKTIRDILEVIDTVNANIPIGFIVVNRDYLDRAEKEIHAIVREKLEGLKKEIDYTKPDFISNDVDALYGYNEAIKEAIKLFK
jgi:hypothetical protein